MFNLIFVVLILAGLSDVVQAQIGERPDTRYDISVTLNTDRHILSGEQTVKYTNRSSRPLREVYFILAANHSSEKNPYIHDIENDRAFWNGWQSKSTSIQFVKDAHGAPLQYKLEKVPPIFQTFSLDNVLLKVELPIALIPGDQVLINMGFETKFVQNKFGDEARWQGFYTWRFGWNPQELSMEGDEWFKDGFRMMPAFFTVKLTVPDTFVVAAGAGIQRIDAEGGGTRTYHLESEVSQLSLPLTMGPGYNLVQGPLGDASIYSYFRGDHVETAKMMVRLAREIIDFYEPIFGKYRYRDLRIAENSAPGTAMASDGLVLMMEMVYKYKDLLAPGILNRLLEYVLAHEIGHLWWGVGVTQDFASENWLSEAFANYLAYVYMEEKYGIERNVFEYEKPGMLSKLIRFAVGDQSFHRLSEATYLNVVRLGWDEEISKDPRDIEYGNAVGPRTYEKGYWVLRALENELGRDAMFALLKTTFEQYQGEQLTIRKFQKMCETQLGKPMGWFFDQWIFGVKNLDYSVDDVFSQKRNGEYVTEVSFTKKGEALANTQLLLKTEDGKTYSHDVDASVRHDTFTLKTENRVTRVQIDPSQKLPDIYRIDNTWPRQIKYHFGLYDDPLDAYSVRYNILPSAVYLPASGDARFGAALGISGGYSPTHQWALSSTVGYKEDRYYFSNNASLNYHYSARNQMQAMFNATGYDSSTLEQGTYQFQFGHQHILYGTPQIGSSSRILLPSNSFLNYLNLRDYQGWYQHPSYQQYEDEYSGAVASWQFIYRRDDSVRLAWWNQWQLEVAPPEVNDKEFFKAQFTSNKRFRLIPNYILTIDGSIAYASENTPTPEKFYFNNPFRSDYGSYYGQRSAVLKADLDFPLLRELEAPVFNLMSLKAVYGNLFTYAGAVNSRLYDGRAMQAAESGAVMKFIFTTLGGFVDLSFDIGMIYPWYTQNTSLTPGSSPFMQINLSSVM